MLMMICFNVSLHLKQKEILPGCKGELIAQPVLPPDSHRKHCQSNKNNVWSKPVAWVEQSINGWVFRIAPSPVTCSIGFVVSVIINIHIFIDNKQINYIISFFQSTSIVKGINILVSIGAGLLARPETNWNPVIQEICFLFLAVGRDRQEIPV